MGGELCPQVPLQRSSCRWRGLWSSLPDAVAARIRVPRGCCDLEDAHGASGIEDAYDSSDEKGSTQASATGRATIPPRSMRRPSIPPEMAGLLHQHTITREPRRCVPRLRHRWHTSAGTGLRAEMAKAQRISTPLLATLRSALTRQVAYISSVTAVGTRPVHRLRTHCHHLRFPLRLDLN